MTTREYEARFLEIDIDDITGKLRKLKARDLGDDLLKEVIYYDKDRTWIKEKKIVRIRQSNSGITLAFKHNQKAEIGGTEELEIIVSDADKAGKILESLGLAPARVQEKKRRAYLFDSVVVSIDEQPNVPPYLEIEGSSETVVKDAARALELDWKGAHLESSREFLEKIYHIPLSTLRFYTFDKIE